MKIVKVGAGTIFPKITGKSANIELPAGEYDENDPEDLRLMQLIPEEDPYYMFPGIQTLAVLLALQERDNVLLYGTTGVGKTMLLMQLAHKLRLPCTRINCHVEMGSPELFGYSGLPDPNIPNDNGWKWTSLTLGIQRPGLVIVDEWDTLRPDVSIGCQRLLEDHQPGLMLPDIDRFLPKHENCIVSATANTRGLGDSSGLYVGTGAQNFAQLNRFHLVLEMEPLEKEKMQSILGRFRVHNKPLKEELVATLTNFYGTTLSAFKASGLSAPLSVRMMLHFARYYEMLGPPALELVILSKLPTDEDKVTVKQLADRAGLIEATS